MRYYRLTNKINGLSVICHLTTDHPDSHYGQPVYVDDKGFAYTQKGLEHLVPWLDIEALPTTSTVIRPKHGCARCVWWKRKGTSGYGQCGSGMRDRPYYACGPCNEYEMTFVPDTIDVDTEDLA